MRVPAGSTGSSRPDSWPRSRINRAGRSPLVAGAPTLRRFAQSWHYGRLLQDLGGGRAMFKRILVPVDLTEPEFAKPAIDTAVEMARASGGVVRIVNVLPMTPVMLAEYVPADFDTQQRQSAEEALAVLAKESGLEAARFSTVVRQGGIYHEVLEEAKLLPADLIVMSSHRPAMKTYFLGSNAGHVVRYAKCSVLVVRR